MTLISQIKNSLPLMIPALATLLASEANAEVQLADVDGWKVTTDGRINAFVSHSRGQNRPDALSNLPWVGFNEVTAPESANADGSISTTRIRSGYMPSTIAFGFSKELENMTVAARLELGIQITNIIQVEIADPTWMEPRAAHLDVSGSWGSIRAGRDFGLFGRQNLFMNFEIGHNYGLGFPCAYELVNGGSCGHVGFGTIWPDFKAQITYTTPTIAEAFNISVGIFDPRNIPLFSWIKTPLPRVEAEAVLNLGNKDFGVKAWVNGFWQTVGTTLDIERLDAVGNPVLDVEGNPIEDPTDFALDAIAVGGGLLATLGPVKLGVAGHTGLGIDAFQVFTFNPIFVSLFPETNADIEFRRSTAFLAQVSYSFGDTWISAGYGMNMFNRLDGDGDPLEVGALPLPRSQTGISAGVFHRVGPVVIALDYFNANYAFDAINVENPIDPNLPAVVEENSQNVNFINAGVTLGW